MQITHDEPFVLVTIPQSHFCEKARWALERLRVPYREEPHAPMLHIPAVYRHKGRRSTPVLVSKAGVFADSTEILQYLDRFASSDRALYPSDPALRREVEELEDRFDRKLGPATRLWVYAFLLPQREEALSLLHGKIPAWEHRLASLSYPVVRRAMEGFMRITTPNTEKSRVLIEETFDFVAERLRDGRPFLVGERFTAADLTFAALSAPVLLPKEYGGPLPALSAFPAEARRLVESWQTHPAGVFALRLFAAERRRTR